MAERVIRGRRTRPEPREPIGWNVYTGGDLGGWTFREFIPNEAALAAEAGRVADEVERQLEDGTL